MCQKPLCQSCKGSKHDFKQGCMRCSLSWSVRLCDYPDKSLSLASHTCKWDCKMLPKEGKDPLLGPSERCQLARAEAGGHLHSSLAIGWCAAGTAVLQRLMHGCT